MDDGTSVGLRLDDDATLTNTMKTKNKLEKGLFAFTQCACVILRDDPLVVEDWNSCMLAHVRTHRFKNRPPAKSSCILTFFI
jgi:hypothetical protein